MPVQLCDLSFQIEEVRECAAQAIDRVLNSGIFIMGPEVEGFEREAADYLGVDFVVAVNSGTDALTIGLRSLGIGEGDEVITSSFTFFATVEAILLAGARPVFVDIVPETFNLDTKQIQKRITDRTRAILPVHLYGQAADMAEVMAVAADHHVRVIEDVAQAFGGSWKGDLLGAIGDVGAFSFFPTKNLGALGDGGMIATKDSEVAEVARMLRAHGARKKYHNEMCGYNSRLDAIQAAILRCKLPYLDAWNSLRREAANRYRSLLADESNIFIPSEAADSNHVYHQFTVRVRDGQRDLLREHLTKRGIGTHIYYPVPIHKMPLLDGSWDLPVTEEAAQEVLSLPIFPGLSEVQQTEVADAIREFFHP